MAMEINQKLDTVLHQQQIILQELGKTRAKSTPHISAGFNLPPGSVVLYVQMMEERLHSSSLDKQALVCSLSLTRFRIADGHAILFIC